MIQEFALETIWTMNWSLLLACKATSAELSENVTCAQQTSLRWMLQDCDQLFAILDWTRSQQTLQCGCGVEGAADTICLSTFALNSNSICEFEMLLYRYLLVHDGLI